MITYKFLSKLLVISHARDTHSAKVPTCLLRLGRHLPSTPCLGIIALWQWAMWIGMKGSLSSHFHSLFFLTRPTLFNYAVYTYLVSHMDSPQLPFTTHHHQSFSWIRKFVNPLGSSCLKRHCASGRERSDIMKQEIYLDWKVWEFGGKQINWLLFLGISFNRIWWAITILLLW